MTTRIFVALFVSAYFAVWGVPFAQIALSWLLLYCVVVFVGMFRRGGDD